MLYVIRIKTIMLPLITKLNDGVEPSPEMVNSNKLFIFPACENGEKFNEIVDAEAFEVEHPDMYKKTSINILTVL
jgi:hypothetical protein